MMTSDKKTATFSIDGKRRVSDVRFGDYIVVGEGTSLRAVNRMLDSFEQTRSTDGYQFLKAKSGEVVIIPKICNKQSGWNAIKTLMTSPELRDQRVVVTGLYKGASRALRMLYERRHPIGELFLARMDACRFQEKWFYTNTLMSLLLQASDMEKNIFGLFRFKYPGQPANEILLSQQGRVLGIATGAEKELVRYYYGTEKGNPVDYQTQRQLHNTFTGALT